MYFDFKSISRVSTVILSLKTHLFFPFLRWKLKLAVEGVSLLLFVGSATLDSAQLRWGEPGASGFLVLTFLNFVCVSLGLFFGFFGSLWSCIVKDCKYRSSGQFVNLATFTSVGL